MSSSRIREGAVRGNPRRAQGWQRRMVGAAWLAASVTSVVLAADSVEALTIDHSDRGSFQVSNLVNGLWKSPNGSYQVRALNEQALGLNDAPTPIEFNRNYVTFDLSELQGTVTSATLEIFHTGYQSSALSETLGFFDVSTAASELLAGDAGANPELVFPDLGSGTSYGSVTVTPADEQVFLSISLNASALADIQALIGAGSFSIGGALQTIDGSFGSGNISERLFQGSGTDDPATRLVLDGVTVIPEPSTALLFGLGLSVLAVRGPRAPKKS